MLKYYFAFLLGGGVVAMSSDSKYILSIAVSATMEKLQLKIEGEGVRGPIFN